MDELDEYEHGDAMSTALSTIKSKIGVVFDVLLATIRQQLTVLKDEERLNAARVACVTTTVCTSGVNEDRLLTTEDLKKFTHLIKEFNPELSWSCVVSELNCEELLLKNEQELRMLVSIIAVGLEDEECNTVKTNLLKTPIPENEENSQKLENITWWYYIDLFDLMVRLGDQGSKSTVESLLQNPVKNYPEVIILACIRSKKRKTQFWEELFSRMIEFFLENYRNSKKIITFIAEHEDKTFEQRLLVTMANWYTKGACMQSRLSRILDVDTDFNRYYKFWQDDHLIQFSIDVAFAASRREYIKFEDWLSCAMDDNKEKIVPALLKFLKRHLDTTPNTTRMMALPEDAMLILLNFLNSNNLKLEGSTKSLIEECIELLRTTFLFRTKSLQASDDIGPPEKKKTKIMLPESEIMNLSESDFAKISSLPGYIEKTLLIQDIVKGSSSILLQAPRRFGKSTNISMIRSFFEVHDDVEVMKKNMELFENFKIAFHESTIQEHFGRYPVIHLDLKTNEVKNYEDAYEVMRFAIHKAFEQHQYLLQNKTIFGDEVDKGLADYFRKWSAGHEYKQMATDFKRDSLLAALDILTNSLCRHFGAKQIIFVADEYDAICTQAVSWVQGASDEVEKIMKRIVNLCMGTMQHMAKGNPKVSKAILTGVSLIAAESLSDLNNLVRHRFQEIEQTSFTKYYALTKDELELLLLKVKTDLKPADIIEYYNGYCGDVLSLYSVESALVKNKLGNYWTSTERTQMLQNVFKNTHMRSILSHLLGDVSNTVDIRRLQKIGYNELINLRAIMFGEDLQIGKLDIFLNYLLELGYFKVENMDTGDEYRIKISIPNREIKKELADHLFLYYVENLELNLENIKLCSEKFQRLKKSECVKNEGILREIHSNIDEIIRNINFSSMNEATIHHVFFVILYHSNFKCFSEIRSSNSSKKRLDLLMLNDEIGIIFELKLQPSNSQKEVEYFAEVGLNQILDKKYYDAFENENYKPTGDTSSTVEYYILIGAAVSQQQKVAFCVLFNSTDIKKKKVMLNETSALNS